MTQFQHGLVAAVVMGLFSAYYPVVAWWVRKKINKKQDS